MNEILKSQNLRDLLANTKKALGRILKCDEVHYLMLNKELIKNYHIENGKTVRK